MMPIAMTIGILLHRQVNGLAVIIPYMIFVMLLFTYLKIDLKEIRFNKMHLWLILIQIFGSIAVYHALLPFNEVVAQGAMICILAPTATAAPVITGMLGGNVASLTAYSLICNMAVAVGAPLFFSYIGYHPSDFFTSLLEISKRVAVLLISPFVIALLMKRFLPKSSDFLKNYSGISFYLWTFSLIIVTGRTVNFIIDQGEAHIVTEILIALAALLICAFQFIVGRKIGRKFDDTVSGGQGLGQKNTILAIWMAQMYLNPLSSIGPGTYVLWQNIVNSYQVWRKRKQL